LEVRLPTLRPAQRLGLALWVWGTVLATSACQAAVVAALLPVFATTHAARQYLREWLYDGDERAAPCQTTLVVEHCFVDLLRWVVAWWRGTELALAIDATTVGNRVVVLTVAVLYRGSAIPVAWHVLPAPGTGSWIEPIQTMLQRLAPATPADFTVLVLVDRGLWSPRVWDQIRAVGWHPLMRTRPDTTFAPLGRSRRKARSLIPGPGHAWVGAGTIYRHRPARRLGTLVVVWEAGQDEAWIVFTDLPPAQIGVAWYGMRVWVEQGFRALKSFGWQWERTRRTEPDRVARHLLVLATATLWGLATGTRVEEAEALGRAPANLRVCPATPPPPCRRRASVFRRGVLQLRWQWLRCRRLWRQLWLRPEPWPEPPPGLSIVIDTPPSELTHA
jgi:hypothetical protein